MNKGIVRKLDHLGRITLPIEFRRAAGIDAMTPLDLFVEGNVIHLNKGKGRRLDELGRYTIPMEIRKRQGWKTGQEMEIFPELGYLCIKKVGCDWCDETEDLKDIKGHMLCRECRMAVVDAVMEG